MSDTPQRNATVRWCQGLLSALVLSPPVLWVLDVPREFGLALFTEQVMAVSYAAALALVFLSIDFSRGTGRPRPPLYDWALALIGFGAAFYVAIQYPDLVNEIVYLPLDGLLVAALLVVLTIEGVRRTAGPALAIIILVFIAYALLGNLLPFGPSMRAVSLSRLIVYLGLDTNALLGTPLQVGVLVILPFILLGQLLNRSGGGDFFSDLSLGLMGRYRGGAGKMAVAGSALFGSISGSAVANVVGTGIVTIPLMKRSGFRPEVAGAVEAVASTGGQLMPPVMGAAAFLMAEFLQVSYGEVLIAAIVPSFLYYAALFVQIDLYAAKNGITAAPASRIPSVLRTFRYGWHYVLPFAVFLWLLFAQNRPPGQAALVASAILVVTSVLFGYRGTRPSLRQLGSAALWTGSAATEILLITGGAGLVIGVLNLTGIAFSLSLALLQLSGDSLAVLLVLAALICIVLGMGMPTVGVYVLLATLLAPAIVQAGIPDMAAHLFVLYFGMLSMVTPPVAIAAFAAANVAQSEPWRTGWHAVRLGWSAYIIPFLFVLSPTLILQGNPVAVIWAVITAIAGVTLTSIGVTGYLFNHLSWPVRLIYIATGIVVLTPAGAHWGGLEAEIAGLALAAILVAWQYRSARSGPAAAE